MIGDSSLKGLRYIFKNRFSFQLLHFKMYIFSYLNMLINNRLKVIAFNTRNESIMVAF